MSEASRKDALIGHTGFVGSNLDQDWAFSARFNSRNIAEIEGKAFDQIVCAGVSAVKWKANKEPDGDWAAIEALINRLTQVEIGHFVLISTVDVYSSPALVTERDEPDVATLEPYGKHRLMLERWVATNWSGRHTIVRLPGLFGRGLKKNVIFDLLTSNMCDRISPRGCFQWYPLRRLAKDLRTVINSGVPLINIAAEPITTIDIQRRFFPDVAIGADDLPAAHYDVRTNYAGVLGGRNPYHLDAAGVWVELEAYIAEARSSRP